MKRLLKWTMVTVALLLLLTLLVLGALYYLLGTDRGFSTTIQQVNDRISGLHIGGVNGNLKDGFSSSKLRYKNDTISLEAIEFSSHWRLGCLLDKTFCLDSLLVNELRFTSYATEDAAKPANDLPIELPGVNLPINVIAEEIKIRKLLFQGPEDSALQQLENIHLSAKTNGNLLTIEMAVAHYEEISLAIAGSVTLDGDYPIDLRSQINVNDILPDSAPEGSGEQPIAVSLSLTNSVRDLSVETLISGSAEASLSGTLQPLEKNLPASFMLRSKKLGWPITSHKQISAVDTQLDIAGDLSDFSLQFSSLLSGVQLPDTNVKLQGLVNQRRLSITAIEIGTLGGKLKGLVDVNWAALLEVNESSTPPSENADSGIKWRTQWDITDLDPSHWHDDIPGSLYGKLRASGHVLGEKWTLDLPLASISGQLRDLPFSLDTRLSKSVGDQWLIEFLTLENDSNQVTIQGEIDNEWSLDTKIDLADLQNFLPGLHGGFEATAQVNGPLQDPDILLSAKASAITFNDLSLQGLSLEADINRLFVADSDVRIKVARILSGTQTTQSSGSASNNQSISNASMSLRGTQDAHVFNAFAEGPENTVLALEVSGQLNESFDWLGRLDKAKLKAPEHSLVLKNKASLSWNNRLKQFAIDAHCWVSDGSKLCLQNNVSSTPSGSALFTLDQYRLRRLNPFLPAKTTLKGTLEMDSTLAWGDKLPGGFSASINTVVSDGGARFPDANGNRVNFIYEQLNVTTGINPTAIQTAIKLQSKALGTAQVDLSMDPVAEGHPIEGDIKLNGFDIGIAKAFLPDFDQFGGTFDIDGSLTGQLSDPRFDGEITLNNPVLRGELLPLPLSGGKLVATINGKRAVIDGNLSSNDGSISVDGSANWQQAEAWRADFTLNGKNLNVQSDPLIESTINSNIDISAQPGVVRINGSVDIPMAKINVEDLPQGAVSVSSDVIIIEDEELGKTQNQGAAASASDIKVLVAMDINLGDDVELSAYGLEANLTGNMNLRLSTPNPAQLGGEISVVDGIYKQYGQNLNASGQILFVGPVNQTRLAIDAVRTIEEDDDRDAGLRIQGTVANPEISLFTEPADKSQDSILSYIVLGRDINETSDQEANLLATAALALTVKGGRNIAGGIADALGVQDFALETRGRGDDTELVVSGRLNDRLLLRYGRSVFEPESTLYLRYDLSKKLYLEAAQGAESAVDLFYSFSF